MASLFEITSSKYCFNMHIVTHLKGQRDSKKTTNSQHFQPYHFVWIWGTDTVLQHRSGNSIYLSASPVTCSHQITAGTALKLHRGCAAGVWRNEDDRRHAVGPSDGAAALALPCDHSVRRFLASSACNPTGVWSLGGVIGSRSRTQTSGTVGAASPSDCVC